MVTILSLGFKGREVCCSFVWECGLYAAERGLERMSV
jgi:hypothetical protein